MHSSRKRNFSHVPEEKRLSAGLSDLYLSNTISASRAGDLFRNAVSSNATALEDLAAIGANRKDGLTRNRDLARKLPKGSHWPPPYFLEAPCLCQTIMWLPHELLPALREKIRTSAGFYDWGKLAATDLQRLQNAAELVGLALLGDAVPFNQDLTMSVLTCADTEMRLPLFVCPKHWVLKGKTWNSILQVVAWSLTQCVLGVFPARRRAMVRHSAAKQVIPREPGIVANQCPELCFYKSEGIGSCTCQHGPLAYIITGVSYIGICFLGHHLPSAQE